MSKKKVDIIEPSTRFDGSLLNEKKKIRVAAYARVSTDSDDQLNSLETQKEYFLDHIGKKPDWEFIGIYYDEGSSGLNTKNRAGFNRMIQDALDGKIDMILSKSISRFARNVIDTLTITRLLKTRGIPIYFEKESLNTLDPNGDFILSFMASFAEEESKSISQNIRWGRRKKYEQGCLSLAYSQFLGYKKGSNKFEMVIDKEQAKTVKLIYRLFLTGQTTGTITNFLIENNIPSPMNKKWFATTVKSILENEKYMGDAILQKSYVVDLFNRKSKINNGELRKYYVYNDHPAIIPKETFLEVQERMEFQKGRHKNNHLYSGLFDCSICGEKYRRSSIIVQFYSETKYRWVCKNRYSEIRCNNDIYYEKELNYAFEQVIMELQKRYDVSRDLKTVVSQKIKDSDLKERLISFVDSEDLPNSREPFDIFFCVAVVRTTALPGHTIQYHLIDGSSITHQLKKWSIKYDCPIPDGKKMIMKRGLN